MLLYASLNIISRPGYELLINNSIEKSQYFADIINKHPDFELVSEPELCLLTYRYVPARTQQALEIATEEEKETLHNALNDLRNLFKSISVKQVALLYLEHELHRNSGSAV